MLFWVCLEHSDGRRIETYCQARTQSQADRAIRNECEGTGWHLACTVRAKSITVTNHTPTKGKHP